MAFAPARLRTLCLTATAVAAVGALAACGSTSNSTSAEASPSAGGSALVKPGQLTVCTHLSYKPFQFKQDGKVVGFDVDLMDLVAKDLGVTQEIVDIEFRQIYDGTAFSTKKCDLGAAGITVTPKRKETVLFSDPYFDASQALLVKKGSGITSLSGLRGKKLGAQTETTGLEYAQKNKAANGYEIVIFDDLPLGVNAVKAGRVEAAINDNGVLFDFAKNNPDTQVVEEFNTGENYGIAGRLNDANATALMAKVNAVIAKIKTDGTYTQIYKKWFGVEPAAAKAAAGSASSPATSTP
ncbi:MAG TPA: transporter substrate-binding domain-containing protein [Dermatophilaceae bacterium]|nr:transporter substrate-binding domain-containing protein [Dermatophilaceae bacterium]